MSTPAPIKIYQVLRSIHFKGQLLEVSRSFGAYANRERAVERAEALTDSIIKLPATKGLSFTFYVDTFEVFPEEA